MSKRWSFEGSGGWEEYSTQQHDAIHSAWIANRKEVLICICGNPQACFCGQQYRVDLKKMTQVSNNSGNIREVRPPIWARKELRITARKEKNLEKAIDLIKEDSEDFKAGEHVEACYRNGIWYKATILEVLEDGNFLIQWQDHDSRDTVKDLEKLRYHGKEAPHPLVELQLSGRGNQGVPAAAEVANALQAANQAKIIKVSTNVVDSATPVLEMVLRTTRALAARSWSALRAWPRLAQSALEQEEKDLEELPQVDLLRLMKELRLVEKLLKSESVSSGPATTSPSDDASADERSGLRSCAPQETLLEWDVSMEFPEDSKIQQGLIHFAALSDDEADRFLHLRVRFPLDFPKAPPEVWVVRPRLRQGKKTPVTFGGRLFFPGVSRGNWDPMTTMCDVLLKIQRLLIETGTEVDCSEHVATSAARGSYLPIMSPLERQRTEAFPTANNFRKSDVQVLSALEAENFLEGVTSLEKTDKIILPQLYLQEICDRSGHLETPAMFEVKTEVGRKRHCMVSDWRLEIDPGMVILPSWVMDDLGIEERDVVEVRGIKLELAAYVKLQPHTADFYDAVARAQADTGKLLLQSLQSSVSALTEDTCVPVTVGDETFKMQVVQLRPQAAVRIVDQNVKAHFKFAVDFEPAPDLPDEAAKSAFNKRMLDKIKSEKEKQELEKAAREERAELARTRRFEATLRAIEAKADGHQGDAGDVELTFRLPNGKGLPGKFPVGAPIAALEAFVLRSAWGQEAKPVGLKLQEAVPPRRKLGEPGGIEAVTKELHRSALLVRPLLDDGPLEGAQAEPIQPSPSSSSAHPGLPPPTSTLAHSSNNNNSSNNDNDNSIINVGGGGNSCSSTSPKKAGLVRTTSELQRNTLEVALGMAWSKAGYSEEEAKAKAALGEVPLPRLARGSKPEKPCQGSQPQFGALIRTSSVQEEEEGPDVEENHDELVTQFRNVVRWATEAEALHALRSNNWNLQAAMNSYFDGTLGPVPTPSRPPRRESDGDEADKDVEIQVDEEAVGSLSGMGFEEEAVRKVLKALKNDVQRAADFLLSHMEDLDSALADL